MFIPIWGRFPFWLIFFRWVGSTTNQICVHTICMYTYTQKHTQERLLDTRGMLVSLEPRCQMWPVGAPCVKNSQVSLGYSPTKWDNTTIVISRVVTRYKWPYKMGNWGEKTRLIAQEEITNFNRRYIHRLFFGRIWTDFSNWFELELFIKQYINTQQNTFDMSTTYCHLISFHSSRWS